MSQLDEAKLQAFLIKSNLLINISNMLDTIPIAQFKGDDELSHHSGSIIAIKYNKIIKGRGDLFKNKIGFKNACHLIICYTLEKKRRKKLVHLRLTAVGTFHLIGIPLIDAERLVFKLFILLEKINKNESIFKYTETTNLDTRFEIVIVPVLNNFMLTLDHETTNKLFSNSKLKIIKKLVDNNFISFMVPGDHAIIIKKPYHFEEFKHHPIRYITWSRKYGKLSRYIEYESYTTLLNGFRASTYKKYLTIRLYSTGKVWISGFDESLIQDEVNRFFKVCSQF